MNVHERDHICLHVQSFALVLIIIMLSASLCLRSLHIHCPGYCGMLIYCILSMSMRKQGLLQPNLAVVNTVAFRGKNIHLIPRPHFEAIITQEQLIICGGYTRTTAVWPFACRSLQRICKHRNGFNEVPYPLRNCSILRMCTRLELVLDRWYRSIRGTRICPTNVRFLVFTAIVSGSGSEHGCYLLPLYCRKLLGHR